MERPIGVTILALLAVLLAILNGIATLRFLGFFSLCRASGHPYFQSLVCPIVRPADLYLGVGGQDALGGKSAGLDIYGCYLDI